MTELLKFHGVDKAPVDTTQAGAIYYTSDGEQYIGKRDGSLLKITDTIFITSLPEVGLSNKLYILSEGVSFSFYIWDGNEFILVSSNSEVDWSNVLNKPNAFVPSEHSHDEHYYTKSEIDNGLNNVTDTLSIELHKVKLLAGDEADYLQNKLDNVTLSVEGSELKVRTIDGLQIGVADINNWLNGTNGNIQNQINSITNIVNSMSSGVKYIGKFETYSSLNLIGNKENGLLAVVLSDENRNNSRSMYVYSENFGMWEFIGAFTFTDEFTALKDTPTNYVNADGKFIKVDETNQKLIFSDIDYSEIKNKPSSTITQIDSSVSKSHEHPNLSLLDTYNQTNDALSNAVNQSHAHTNKVSLDKLSVNEKGELLINGVVYVPKKQMLYARRGLSDQTLVTGDICIFNSNVQGDIPYNSTTGLFTLTAGKTYQITVTASMNTEGYVILRLVDSNNTQPHANSAIWTAVTSTWKEASAGNLEVVVTPLTTKEFKIHASSVNGTSSMRTSHSCLIVKEL